MDQRALRVLEFDKIKKRLEERTASSLGRSYIETLEPLSDRDEVTYRLKETTDSAKYLWRKGAPPFGGIHDIRGSLKRVEIGGVLGIGELLKVGDTLRCSRIIKQYLTQDVPEEYEGNIALELGRQIGSFKQVEDAISMAILNEEELSDSASPELASIRRSIRQKQDSIKDKLSGILRSADYKKVMQDGVVTMRGDRYVIPVKLEYKSLVPGLVHDMSSSGATAFIEPLAVVEANNEIKALLVREQHEIERILAELTSRVAEVGEDLTVNVGILGQLDFMFSKAKLSRDYNGTCPKLVEERRVKIKKGRHPLLDKQKVVPVDIELGDSFSTLIITGPNTGGKTVTLKTVGLFVLMNQSGLHVPVQDGSEFGLFDNVFADIGDEQSIEQSLSTFSSHMKNIVKILDEADEGSLALFDELGAGTDPTEGAALATAILDGLTQRGIRTMATTHYSELKLYAMTTQGVQNACCEFDVETLRPTYRLLVGIPGKSNAFAISEKLGLGLDIIELAKAYISQDNLRFEDVLGEIEHSRTLAEHDKEKAESFRQQMEAMKQEIEKEREKIEREKDKILQKAKDQARNIVVEARSEAALFLDQMKELQKAERRAPAEKDMQILREGIRKMENMEGGYVEPFQIKASFREPPKNLKPGESVLMLNLNQKASVVDFPDADGQVTVQAGIMKIKVHISQLKRIDDQKESLEKMHRVRVAGVKASPVKLELDLRGLNSEEALERVDKYVDDAIIAGLHEVTIIHGKGTGVLRKAVHDFLRGHSHVEEYRLGKFGEGETGVTIVSLRG